MWQAEFRIEESQHKSQADQAEGNFVSSAIGPHQVRVGTFCDFKSSFLPSFNPPRHAAHSIATASWRNIPIALIQPLMAVGGARNELSELTGR